jgi:catechol 2,3-dioxygenase-like lactoylglutathione lyase family enzyme
LTTWTPFGKSPIKLDHATLRTSDLEGTRNFLEAVLDLTPGYRPAFPFPAYWLYADGEPIVHSSGDRS